MVISLKKQRKLQKFFRNSFVGRARTKLWLSKQGHLTPCRHNGCYIGSKKDRYGSNGVPWINAIALAEASAKPLYHACTDNCYRFKDTVLHSILLKLSQKVAYCQSCDLMNREGWLASQTNELIDISNKPLPEFLIESGLRTKLFSFYQNAKAERNWNIDFVPEKTVMVHVRLDDMNYKTKDNKQAFIGEGGLANLLKKLRASYSKHEIIIVTSPLKQDIALCEKVISDSKVDNAKVLANKDMDQDLYAMMLADVLILSRSTFCFVSALLHQGAEVYSYETWTHLDELLGAYHDSAERGFLSTQVKILG